MSAAEEAAAATAAAATTAATTISAAAPAAAAAPFGAWAGPQRGVNLLIVGEAWGEAEAEHQQPFCGSSGQELFRMLGEAMPGLWPEEHRRVRTFYSPRLHAAERGAWLAHAGVAMTNVLNLRPQGNRLGSLCGKAKDFPPGYDLPPLGRSGPDFPQGAHLRPEYLCQLARLRAEIELAQPQLLLAAGNTACWALLQATNIGSIRGAIAETRGPVASGRKVLPTYHPAGVMRNWAWRPIVVADLIKAFREAQFPEIRRPKRQILINPSLGEAEAWTEATLSGGFAGLAVDVETGQRQIKCIGFARSSSEALVIPFVDLANSSGSYWPSAEAELRAWGIVERLLRSDLPKIFQNGLYDLQYILPMGIAPEAVREDTMLLHHALFPGMLKGLGFLGSIYTNEQSWKLMNRPKSEELKRDE